MTPCGLHIHTRFSFWQIPEIPPVHVLLEMVLAGASTAAPGRVSLHNLSHRRLAAWDCLECMRHAGQSWTLQAEKRPTTQTLQLLLTGHLHRLHLP